MDEKDTMLLVFLDHASGMISFAEISEEGREYVNGPDAESSGKWQDWDSWYELPEFVEKLRDKLYGREGD